MSHWYDVLFILLTGGFLCFSQFAPITIPDTLIHIIPFLYTVTTKRGTWGQRILWTLILMGVMDAVIMFMMNLYTRGSDIEILLQNTSLRIGFVINTNIVLTIALLLVARLSHRETLEVLDISSLIALVVSLLLEFTATEFLYYYQLENKTNENLLLYTNICILGLVILTLLFYHVLNRAARIKHVAELKLQTLSLQLNHQHEMNAVYHDMLTMRHDMKHRINIIKQVLQTSPNVDQKTIQNLLETNFPPTLQYMTGCTAVDAVLTAKHAIMEQHQISFTFQPYPLQILPLDDASFCILLSNLLDNAIEAVLRIEDPNQAKEIHLSFARSWQMFYLTCTNTMNPNTIQKMGDRFISSKENKSIHGFGLESIRQTVLTNQGTCNVSTDDRQFCVQICLPDKEEAHD